MCVDLCYRTLGDPSINPTLARAKCYHTMDAFVKLVVVLVRFIGDSTNQVTKVNLLNKVLVTVTQVLLQDQVLLSFVVLLCVATRALSWDHPDLAVSVTE